MSSRHTMPSPQPEDPLLQPDLSLTFLPDPYPTSTQNFMYFTTAETLSDATGRVVSHRTCPALRYRDFHRGLLGVWLLFGHSPAPAMLQRTSQVQTITIKRKKRSAVFHYAFLFPTCVYTYRLASLVNGWSLFVAVSTYCIVPFIHCTSGVPSGGGVWGVQLPSRNSEGPPKSCQTQPDCENH